MHFATLLDTMGCHWSYVINLRYFSLCSNILMILHSTLQLYTLGHQFAMVYHSFSSQQFLLITILSLILHFLWFLGIMKCQRLELLVCWKTNWIRQQLEEVRVPLPVEAQEQQQQLPERNWENRHLQKKQPKSIGRRLILKERRQTKGNLYPKLFFLIWTIIMKLRFFTWSRFNYSST